LRILRLWLPFQPRTNLKSLGNVTANQGFIQHLDFQNAGVLYYLKAQYTATWGAMQSLSQLIGMVLLNPISDTIGRKMTLYVLWVLLAGVSVEKAPLFREEKKTAQGL
jgi:hypothetical protein